MFCKKCGTENPDDYSFCNNCGFPLMKAPGASEKTGASGGWDTGGSTGTGTGSSGGSFDEGDGGREYYGGGFDETESTVAMTGGITPPSPGRLSEDRSFAGSTAGAVEDLETGRKRLPRQYKPIGAPVYFLLSLVFSFGVVTLYIVYTFIYGGTEDDFLKGYWNDHFLILIIILGVCGVCFVINLLLAMLPRRVPVKSFARGYLIIFFVNAALLAALIYVTEKGIIHYDVFTRLQTFFAV